MELLKRASDLIYSKPIGLSQKVKELRKKQKIKKKNPSNPFPTNEPKKVIYEAQKKADAKIDAFEQKVQVLRSSDGKIQVHGLLPGQQLVQMPDGKLQIFSQPTPGQPAVQATIPQPTVQTPVHVTTPVQMPVQTPPPSTTVQQSSRIVVHPNGAMTTTASNQTTPKIVTLGSNKSIVATPLQPGQSIPPDTTVFMSSGKTKATIANQQTSNQTTTPALPSTLVPAGTKVFMSGGKTYCIPKATIANQQTSN